MSASSLRDHFPIFKHKVAPHPWVYFDSAATSHKPQSVIAAVEGFYRSQNANVHRSSHSVSAAATQAFEQARVCIQGFINAASEKEIIWTKGATESINLVAAILAKGHFTPGDEIVLSSLEHHANIVPWQQIATELGLTIRVIPVDEQGVIQLERGLSLITNKTALVAIGHVSNALGNINPIGPFIARAKKFGALTLIDGAQAVAHLPVDVQALDCDFYLFSGHKLFGPTGIGVLYGKQALLSALPPYQTGGEMIEKVSFSGSTFQGLPFKYEAGTPNIAGVLGLAAAVQFIQGHRLEIEHQELALYQQLLGGLQKIAGVHLWGERENSICIVSFTVDGLNNQDVGILLNEQNFAVRIGHHCAMPLMQALRLEGTIRVSLSCYNTHEEVARFLQALSQSIVTVRKGGEVITGVAQREPCVVDVSSAGGLPASTPLADNLRLAKAWDETYRQIMLAGKQLNKLPMDDRIGQYEVFGCESLVWLKCETQCNQLLLSADSPSKIVRGLLAIIFEPLANMPLQQIRHFDLPNYLDQLGLAKHLSQSRGNGLLAVVDKIKRNCG
ncbi:MAG: cysteine desulfurase/selenocysteine lyase [Paraglaciecola sp.]|jgi:cysteine desulfurase/selenocysteine lyase